MDDDIVSQVILHLENANKVSCPMEKRDILRKLSSLVENIKGSKCSHVFIRCEREVNQLLQCGFVPEFTERDFTSYDKSDFAGRDIITHDILNLVKTIISVSTHPCESDNERCNDTNQGRMEDPDRYMEDSKNHISSMTSNHLFVMKILPNLLILIAGNVGNPTWSSNDCQSECQDLLKKISKEFDCSIQHILIDNSFHQIQSDLSKSAEKNILGHLLNTIEKPVSRSRWEKNPFLCEVFCWLVLQISSPYLSNHIDQVLATSLNFIHSHESCNKSKGLISLKHLMENVSGEELRWYNRSEVIYETLKHQTHLKEGNILDEVYQCIFMILKVMERNVIENSDKHHETMTNLLRDAEMENLLVIRRVLISNIAILIPEYGIKCVQHLSKLLFVVKAFLEVEDSAQETARIAALQALERVFIVAWPRISQHSQHILDFLLKFIINIESQHFAETKSSDVKKQLILKTNTCVVLLLKINPMLRSSLSDIYESEKLHTLRNFVKGCLSVSA